MSSITDGLRPKVENIQQNPLSRQQQEEDVEDELPKQKVINLQTLIISRESLEYRGNRTLRLE